MAVAVAASVTVTVTATVAATAAATTAAAAVSPVMVLRSAGPSHGRPADGLQNHAAELKGKKNITEISKRGEMQKKKKRR